jgi:cytochrome c peroxidase
MSALDGDVRARTWIQRSLPFAAAVAVGVAAACGSEDPGTGPEPQNEAEALRGLALAAGLAPVPDEPVRPVENAYRVEKVELGRLLFFDPILSGPMDVACSTCHLPRFAFADGRQFPSGAGGVGLGPERSEPPPPMRAMERNSPTVFNAGVYGRMSTQPTTNGTMFWGGGAFGIEDQALNPIAAEKELRGTTYSKVHAIDSVLVRLRGNDGYLDRFADAYPEIFDVYGRERTRLITATTLRRALAAYVRELITPDAPLDRFLKGDDQALSARAKAGLRLFVEKGGCAGCHTGPLLSDFSMHVLGARQEGLGRDTTLGDDLGWGEHGGKLYSFRTPPLRQVDLTAPYFHAGTAATLEEVVRFKNAGVSEHAAVAASDLDPLFEPLALTDDEVLDLVAFMAALTDRTTILGPLFQAPDDVPSGLEVPR